jgi:hypothetical protein
MIYYLNFSLTVGEMLGAETLASTESFFEKLKSVVPQKNTIFIDIGVFRIHI